tara:strand:+ start:365 stop:712 length:348 start_codon:yes stop_codon:yes gene_type:complete
MASFIKIQTQEDIYNANGIGFLVNPEKIVSVQSDGGDPGLSYMSFLIPKNNGNVFTLELEANIPAASTGFPVTQAMNKAIETAILTPGTVVDFNAILKSIAGDGTFIIYIGVNAA